MTKRFDVCSPRPRKDSDKPYWHRVGTAFEGEKGTNVVLDSLPLPDKDGRVSLFLFEQKDKAAKPDNSQGAAPRRQTGGISDSINDEIPFAAEFR